MIAILVPTRARPDQCRRMIESVFATAKGEFCIYLYIADDDPRMDEYNELSKSYGHDDDVYWCHGPDYPTVHKWNMLAKEAKACELFMLGADDMYFATPGWDKALADHYNALENKIHVYHLQDSRDPKGTPHPIVTREYISALGYFLPPIFLHWFIDTWTREIGKANGVFTHFHDYSLVHNKPSDNGMADDTHNRIRLAGWLQRDNYVNETCQHFLECETVRVHQTIVNTNIRNKFGESL